MGTVSVVTRGEFVETGPEVVFVEDAFGPGQAIYVRELTVGELEQLVENSRTFGDDDDVVIDPVQLQVRQFQHCIITGPEPDAEPLFSEAELGKIRQLVKPGHYTRLITVIDALSGYRSAEAERLGEYRSAYQSMLGSSSSSGVATGSLDSPASSDECPSAESGDLSPGTSD